MKKVKKIKPVEIQSDEDEFFNEKEGKESGDLLESFEDDNDDLSYYRDIKESMDRF